MALRWKQDCLGDYSLVGLRDDFAKYEREIFNGTRECPFTVEFRNAEGKIIYRGMIPLASNGKPKIELFE